MVSKIEMVLILSHEIDEKIFNGAREKLKKIKFFVSAYSNSNRLYINLEGAGDISKVIPEVIELLSIYFKDYKIGIRDYYILNYELEIPCNFLGTLKLPIVQSIVGNGKSCKIIFKDLEKNFLKRGFVERVVRLIDRKTKREKDKIIFEYKEGEKIEVNLREGIKKGIIKGLNFYLPNTAKEISYLKDKIISDLKKKFECKEIFVPEQLPIDLIKEYNISDLIPKEALSNFISKPENATSLYDIFYLTGELPKFKAKNKAILFNDIPITLYKALENTKQKGFFYYTNCMKINLIFFENENYNYLKKEIINFFKEFLNEFKIKYRILQKTLNLREKEIDYYKFEVKADKWVKVIDILFAEDLYTKVFKIDSKSGHITIDLDKLGIINYGNKSERKEDIKRAYL
jgi:hypothetical protein